MMSDIAALEGLSADEVDKRRRRERTRQREALKAAISQAVDSYILECGIPAPWRTPMRSPRKWSDGGLRATRGELESMGVRYGIEAKARKRDYAKRWREEHSEHLAVYEKTPARRAHSRENFGAWYEKNRDAVNAKRRDKRAAEKDTKRAADRAYYQANKARIIANRNLRRGVVSESATA